MSNTLETTNLYYLILNFLQITDHTNVLWPVAIIILERVPRDPLDYFKGTAKAKRMRRTNLDKNLFRNLDLIFFKAIKLHHAECRWPSSVSPAKSFLYLWIKLDCQSGYTGTRGSIREISLYLLSQWQLYQTWIQEKTTTWAHTAIKNWQIIQSCASKNPKKKFIFPAQLGILCKINFHYI